MALYGDGQVIWGHAMTLYKVGPQLVNITPITMVYNYSYWGLCSPTSTWGGDTVYENGTMSNYPHQGHPKDIPRTSQGHPKGHPKESIPAVPRNEVMRKKKEVIRVIHLSHACVWRMAERVFAGIFEVSH